MKISAIVAMSKNYVIGNRGKVPWYIAADMNRFKNLTMGKTVLMGRKTFDSIGSPLVDRVNIVLTHDRDFRCKGVVVANTIEKALEKAGDIDELFVIGGETIYKQMADMIDYLYITAVINPDIYNEIEGDTHFPLYLFADFEKVCNEEHVGFPLCYDFSEFERPKL